MFNNSRLPKKITNKSFLSRSLIYGRSTIPVLTGPSKLGLVEGFGRRNAADTQTLTLNIAGFWVDSAAVKEQIGYPNPGV
jgi:hypothetical protein